MRYVILNQIWEIKTLALIYNFHSFCNQDYQRQIRRSLCGEPLRYFGMFHANCRHLQFGMHSAKTISGYW